MEKVYILPVTETAEYLKAKSPNDEEKSDDFALYVDENITEEECAEIVAKSYDPVANTMTIRQFQAQFNFALEDGEITSNRYFIKFF